MIRNFMLSLMLVPLVFAQVAVSMGRINNPPTTSTVFFHDGSVAVKSFSRPVTFLRLRLSYHNASSEVVHPTIFFLNARTAGELFIGIRLPERHEDSLLCSGIIGVKPDGSSFFVVLGSELFEIGADLKIIRRIVIGDFQLKLENKDQEFAGFGVCGNQKLWFAAKSITERKKKSYPLIGRKKKSYSFKNYLVEWNFDSPPSSAVLGKVETFNGMVVDEDERRVFTFGTPPMDIFSFSENKKGDFSLSYGDFLDFTKEHGLLLSKKWASVKGECPLILVKKQIGAQQTVIGKGFSAVWGYDGYVYYFDGERRLRRCEADGKDHSIIFTSSCSELTEPGVFIEPAKMSYDRTFMAFHHKCGKGKEDSQTDLFLLDIKNKEYIRLVNESFEYNKMAWLINKVKETGKCIKR